MPYAILSLCLKSKTKMEKNKGLLRTKVFPYYQRRQSAVNEAICNLDIVYAYTKRQDCWVHKLRNVAKYLRKSDEREVLTEAKKIYKAETKREAVKLFRNQEVSRARHPS